MGVMFGDDKVINAAACFGKDAVRRVENFVWFTKHSLMLENKPQMERDLKRGQRLLKLVKKHQRVAPQQPLPRWMRTAHDNESSGHQYEAHDGYVWVDCGGGGKGQADDGPEVA